MSQDYDAAALAADLAAAWLSNPNTHTDADSAAGVLRTLYAAAATLGEKEAVAGPAQEMPYRPAVTARKSLANHDVILSMIDGKPYKSLRRHLSANGLTPDEYRARYGLKADYPMVAPGYSEARSATAKRLGLGRKPKVTAADRQVARTSAYTAEQETAPTAKRTKGEKRAR